MDTALFALLLIAPAAEVAGETRQFHTVTVTWDGPQTDERADPSPFVAYELSCTFTHDSGAAVSVPGFFAADGNAAETSATGGNKWRVRFSPPLTGRWTYEGTLLREGTPVGLTDDRGSFSVAESDKKAPDFRGRGHLRYVGERYLKFSGDGSVFLKAGVNSPETMLGYADFDGTYRDLETHDPPAPHDPIPLPHLDWEGESADGLHRFGPHVGDWTEGDPTWQDGKGKGLIGGLNYLGGVGVNSVYFLTMNVNGDGRNVWPWTGPTAFDRFDVSKLDQWEIVFEHAQSLGIQLHVVLQETENDHLLDRGDLGPDRKRYLREMVARFAHHPAVQWNLGEENVQSPEQVRAMSGYIKEIDAYSHPVALHNDHWSPGNVYELSRYRTEPTLDALSIQSFQFADVHALTAHFWATPFHTRHLVVCADELGGANFGTVPDGPDMSREEERSALWGNLLAGGGGVEWYFGWQNNSPASDLSAEDWRTRETVYRQSKLAVDFLHEHVPLASMRPADETTVAAGDYALAGDGVDDAWACCVYFPRPTKTRLAVPRDGCYRVRWLNPRQGGLTGGTRPKWGPGWIEVQTPDRGGPDWVALVERVEPVFTGDDVIAVEAEHHASQTRDRVRMWVELHKSGEIPEADEDHAEGFGDPQTWVRSAHAAATSASGKHFLRALPDTRKTHDDRLVRGENFFPEPGQAGVLSYRVAFPRAGRYYVWVRAFSTGTEDNGLHVGLNDDWPESGQRMQWCKGKNAWTWACAQRTEEVHCGVPMQIWLDVPDAGVHTVRFSVREDGFAFDKFLLTRDAEYRPSGEGPTERITPAK